MNTVLANFHFIRPYWLLLLPIATLIIVYVWRRHSQRSNWQQICDKHLVEHLLVGRQQRQGNLPFVIMLLATVFSCIALAGPTFQKLPQPVYRAELGRIILFDLSLSMNSTDLKPSRLARAKFKLADFVKSGAGLQQGLVVFAGDAFVVSPLTDDTETLLNLIPSLNTNTIPVQGSRPDLAMALAPELFRNAGLSSGEIVLFTDSTSSESLGTALQVSDQGYRLSIIAVGTSQGEPIPLPEGGFLKDIDGDIVIPAVDFDTLRSIARAGKGQMATMTPDNSDFKRIEHTATLPELPNSFNKNDNQFTGDEWLDLGPWLLLPILFLSLLGFRKGWVLVVVVLIQPLNIRDAMAFEWIDLWSRQDQQAAKNLQADNLNEAAQSTLPDWRGAAQYKQNEFAAAIDSFSTLTDLTGLYNMGNALAKNGELNDAKSAYEQVLELQPDHEDARYNLDLINNIRNQQQQNQSDSGQQNKDGEQQESAEKSEQDQSQQSEQEKQDNKESQNAQSSSGQDNQEDDSDNASNKENSQGNESDSASGGNEEEKSSDKQNNDEPALASQAKGEPSDEQKQALQQWLRQIPDDPGGLLRRKFALQYQQRPAQRQSQSW